MRKETAKIITAAGAGAIIGGIAGVLLAPKKGSETRAQIKECIINLKNKTKKLDKKDIEEYIDKKLDELDIELAKLDMEIDYKKAKKQAKKVIRKIQKLISYTKKKNIDEFEELISDLKEKAEEISEEILTNL